MTKSFQKWKADRQKRPKFQGKRSAEAQRGLSPRKEKQRLKAQAKLLQLFFFYSYFVFYFVLLDEKLPLQIPSIIFLYIKYSINIKKSQTMLRYFFVLSGNFFVF